LLGHWYLNQPGLKPWALARLTQLALIAAGATALLGAISVSKLATASTEGSVLGLPGFGDSFGAVFYGAWVLILVFTIGVVVMARRCVKIRSIQSATGLYYVALLTAGVSEFLVRYLMVNAA
jgi:high-affinity Fe2+/Pb2+ permease